MKLNIKQNIKNIRKNKLIIYFTFNFNLYKKFLYNSGILLNIIKQNKNYNYTSYKGIIIGVNKKNKLIRIKLIQLKKENQLIFNLYINSPFYNILIIKTYIKIKRSKLYYLKNKFLNYLKKNEYKTLNYKKTI